MPAIANRPTPEHIAGLFVKYGITPDPEQYLLCKGPVHAACGCVLGVLLIEATGSIDAARPLTNLRVRRNLARLRQLPLAYVDGLDDGFTGTAVPASWEEDPEYSAGFRTGLVVRQLTLTGPTCPPALPLEDFSHVPHSQHAGS
jgi:hypothetical protein